MQAIALPFQICPDMIETSLQTMGPTGNAAPSCYQ